MNGYFKQLSPGTEPIEGLFIKENFSGNNYDRYNNCITPAIMQLINGDQFDKFKQLENNQTLEVEILQNQVKTTVNINMEDIKDAKEIQVKIYALVNEYVKKLRKEEEQHSWKLRIFF